ncbi:hypothetical protein [Allosphingosinicella sp.]|uniref:hypothetical protein n=1 Tax=Allosphingosinicella sp. TaxID=2823234 RepID=UPI002FC1A6BD
MAKRLFRLGALLAASLIASVAEAAVAGDAPDNEIVVTGLRESEAAAAEFVGAISVDHDNQIARFEGSICPAAFGLPGGEKSAVESRLHAVAEEVGIEVGRPDCRPNLVVIVAADPVDFIRTLHRKRPGLFRDAERRDIARLTAASTPGQAWHLLERRESDGRRAEHFVDTRGEFMDAHLTPSHQFSRLKKSMRPALTLAFVVIDLESAKGLTVPQLADYWAMRTLAMTRPGTAVAAEGRSILGLFDDRRAGRAPAQSLTARDLAYLKALYSTRSVSTAAQQRATMARIAARELAGRMHER